MDGLFSLLAQSDAEQAGRLVGQAIGGLLLPGIGVWRTLVAIRNEGADNRSAAGLLLMFLMWIACTAVDLARPHVGNGAVFRIGLGLTVILTTVATMVLAIAGLVTRRRSDPPKRGLWMSLTTLGVGCLVMIPVLGAAAGRMGATGGRSVAAAERDEQVFEDLNFAVRPTDGVWTKLPASSVNADASLALVRTNPYMYFVVIAERWGEPIEPAMLAGISEANLRGSGATALSVSEHTPRKIGGTDGFEFHSRATIDSQQVHYRHAVTTHNGFAYQLIAWTAAQNDADALAESFASLVDGFRLVDPDASAIEAPEPESPYVSPRFGFRVDVPAGLRSLDDPESLREGVEFLAAAPGDVRRLAVMAAALGPVPVELDRLGPAMIAELSWDLDEDNVREVGRGKIDGPASAEYIEYLKIDTEEPDYDELYRMRVIAWGEFAYLVTATSRDTGPGGVEATDRLLAAFTLPSDSADVAIADEVGETERERLARVVGRLGIDEYDHGLLDSAVEHCELAARWNPDHPTIIDNLAVVAAESDGPAAALERFDRVLGAAPTGRHARLARARLLSGAGRFKDAIEAFAAIRGPLSEDDLFAMCNAAVDAEQYDEALAALDAAIARRPAPLLRRWRGVMASRAGQHEDAIARLRELLADRPDDADVCVALAEAYEEAEQYTLGVELCQDFAESHEAAAAVLPVLGRLQTLADDYRGAQATLREALRRDPRDELSRELLTYVSGLLGRGDNQRVREPIDPVETPPALEQRLPPDPPAEDLVELANETGAVYLSRTSAYDFRRGESRRCTERRRLYVGNQRGVEAYSTITLHFDPLVERVYINRLAVLDADGSAVAEAELDDYYVLDGDESGYDSYDQRLVAPVPGLRPGRIVELAYTRESLGSANDFGYEDHYLATADPVLLTAVSVTGDANTIASHASGVESEAAGGDTLLWVVERPERVVIEPMQPSLDAVTPWVRIADRHPDWATLGDDYLEDLREVLAEDAATVQRAKRLAAEGATDAEKVARIAAAVQRELTYHAQEFGVRGVIPNRVARIRRASSGDCKDHAVLLYHLLRAAGVDARLALVHTEDLVAPELPALDQFDHMVVAVPDVSDGGSRWELIDTTSKHLDPIVAGSLAPESGRALLLAPSESRFVTAPAFDAADGNVSCSREIEIDAADGGAVLRVAETLRLGRLAALPIRAALRDSSPSEQRETLWRFIGEGKVGTLHEASLDNLDDLEKPLELRCRYDLEEPWTAIPGDPPRRVGSLPTHWAGLYFNASPVEERRTPWRVVTPLSYHAITRMTAPGGFRFAQAVPGRFGSSNKAYTWEVGERVESAGSLTVAARLTRTPGEFAAGDYADYQQAVTKSVRALRRPVTILAIDAGDEDR